MLTIFLNVDDCVFLFFFLNKKSEFLFQRFFDAERWQMTEYSILFYARVKTLKIKIKTVQHQPARSRQFPKTKKHSRYLLPCLEKKKTHLEFDFLWLFLDQTKTATERKHKENKIEKNVIVLKLVEKRCA